MSPLPTLLTMSALLGLTSFLVGMLPLSFTFSGKYMSRLSSLGTGLLLGTALGVIIPEYVWIETIASSSKTPGAVSGASIALPLLIGFSLMLLVEQFSSHPSHSHSHHPLSSLPRSSTDTAFDVELSEVELSDGPLASPRTSRASSASRGYLLNEEDGGASAYALTIGLVIHGLADGLALGVSALSGPDAANLSLLVFLALAIHKAPTALAYTVSLLSTSLPRAACRRHLLVFSASTPVGALLSYTVFSAVGSGDVGRVGTALLVSAGSFLYVATVLQPVSHERTSSAEEVNAKMRTLLVLLGMFIPVLMSSLLEHNHGAAPAVAAR